MRTGLTLGIAVALALASARPAVAEGQPAGNPFLLGGERLYANLEFEAALDQLTRARNYPATTPQELTQVNLYLGLVNFNLGNAEAGKSAFRAAIALNPEVRLPPGVSPKIVHEWEMIRVEMAQVDQRDVPVATPPATHPTEANLTPPPAASPSTTATTLTEPEPSMVSTVGPYAVAGVGVVAAAVGVIMGVSANSQAQTAAAAATSQVDVQNANHAASRDATAANVLYAAAGAAVVAGVIWWIAR